MAGMKALSIRQPWAWLILNAGKDIENREWGPRSPSLHAAHLLQGERILLHASKGMTRGEYEDAKAFAHSVDPERIVSLPQFDWLERGGIVGSVFLWDIVTRHPSPWFFGPIGLVLRDARPLPFRPYSGALGFFEVTDAAA